MKKTLVRLFSGLVLLGVVAVAGSCDLDQGPTAVVVADTTVAPNALLGSLLRPLGLLRCDPLPPDTETRTIGPSGGFLQIGPHLLSIPPGALDAPVTITGTIVPGPVNAVRFTPEGLEFNRWHSAYLTMSYANCNLLGRLLPKRIAYVEDGGLDILYYLLSFDLLRFRLVTGKVDHFSSYAVAW
jgi:hypothetical protein